ncbi:purine-cytosine permease fcy21 [Stemphylium lycopersici]|uniref:Nucleobase transmembrane transporter n=1 Tax=Stemphylium lycopersici TaxID=183478 RepID=A0A364N677_STELY|nr:purine-cytosine permease fcy21 [Stemphylium lycopersici]RAR12819.1 nucleobase transmembrane transporter [Stemphylium lycopersici]
MSNEKEPDLLEKVDASSTIHDVEPELGVSEPVNALQRFVNKLDAVCGVEARGIERIPEELRERPVSYRDYIHMFTIWFSMNCTANQLTLGVLGPVSYSLGLTDSLIICLFGTIFGSVCTGYISTFGPRSGLRTLNVAKYTMGWWPSKLCVILNLCIEIGYGLIDCLVGGLLLSAVNGGGMSVIVGIIIVALITWVVVTFGIKWFYKFEQFVWAPTVLVLFILIGVAGPHFDTTLASSGSGAVLHGNRVSYFFLVASGPLSWSSASADYVVYYPKTTNRWLTFAATTCGITCGKLLIEFLGIGLGSGLLKNPIWKQSFESDGIGALVVEAYRPLNGFGSFCCVILAVCIAANNIPGTYAAALNWQQLGAPFAKIPRPIWSTFSCIVFTVIAIAGRDSLFDIFINWLSLIGYWTIIWITMTVQDEYIFRKGVFDWEIWDRKDLLPHGFAALFAMVVGWVLVKMIRDIAIKTSGTGEVLIVDLTDLVVDVDAACVIFDTCRSIFLAQTPGGKIVALDEAHNYLLRKNTAAGQFTDRLLKTIREQRH